MRISAAGVHASWTWRIMVLSLALVCAGSGALAGPAVAAGTRPSPSLLSLLVGALEYMPSPADFGLGMLTSGSINYGSDGRLTVLVVGSDFRYSRPSNGERTDTVLVATINPTTKQMAVVSIPRDTGNLPLPDPTDTYQGKVNSLLAHYKRIVGTREAALEKMREAIAYALQIEIDYVFFTRFDGFDFLVDQVDGVYVDIPAEIRDTRIYDDLTRPPGAKFLAGTNVREGGSSATKCYATRVPIKWSRVPDCRHALIYVRSRHGTVGVQNNNDYKRDWRQQSFLISALRRVIERGNGAALTALGGAALSRPDDIYTTLPISSDTDLLALFTLFDGAQNQPFLQAVLKPDKYAYRVPGTRRWELRLDVVRALTAEWFAKVPGPPG